MRFAVIIGHKNDAQGADGKKPLSKSEWKFHIEDLWPLIEKFAQRADLETKMFDKSGMTYLAAGQAADFWLNKSDKKCAIELHFNSAMPGSYGTETLVESDDAASIALANIVQKNVAACFDRKGSGNRGVKKLISGDRGHYPLLCVKSPMALIEPAFAGSNIMEASLLFYRKEAYAKCLVDSAIEFMNSRNQGG